MMHTSDDRVMARIAAVLCIFVGGQAVPTNQKPPPIPPLMKHTIRLSNENGALALDVNPKNAPASVVTYNGRTYTMTVLSVKKKERAR